MSEENMEEIPVITDAPSDESNDLKDKKAQETIEAVLNGAKKEKEEEVISDVMSSITDMLKNFKTDQPSLFESLTGPKLETNTSETETKDEPVDSVETDRKETPKASTFKEEKSESKEEKPAQCPFSFFGSEQFISILSSLLTTYLTQSAYSSSKPSFSRSKDTCPINKIIKDYNNLWEGLNDIENKKVRAICFMNNLSRFHESVWSFAKKHDDKLLTKTALDLSSEKLRNEILNVMNQLQN